MMTATQAKQIDTPTPEELEVMKQQVQQLEEFARGMGKDFAAILQRVGCNAHGAALVGSTIIELALVAIAKQDKNEAESFGRHLAARYVQLINALGISTTGEKAKSDGA